jgi:hypothetical protein
LSNALMVAPQFGQAVKTYLAVVSEFGQAERGWTTDNPRGRR